VRHLVFARAKARSLPVLMVTHDAEDAQAAGGTIITLQAQPTGNLPNHPL
jgi:putative thiamine transport system ATP-binding protein